MQWGAESGATDEITKELTELGATAVPIEADLVDPAAPERIFGAAEEQLGNITALVMCHCESVTTGLLDTTVESFDRHFAVNARATWLLIREYGRRFTGPHGTGRIIALTSDHTVGNLPYGGPAGYEGEAGAGCHQFGDDGELVDAVNSLTRWTRSSRCARTRSYSRVNGGNSSCGTSGDGHHAVRTAHVALVGRLATGLRPLQLTTVQTLVGTALFAAPAIRHLPTVTNTTTWLQLVYLALFCSVFASLAQTWAVQRTSASRASLLLGTEPIWAVAIGISLGSEHLTVPAAIGALLLVVGTTWGQSIERTRRHEPLTRLTYGSTSGRRSRYTRQC